MHRTVARLRPLAHACGLVGASVVVSLLALPGVSLAADRPATPSNFASVFSSAQAGDTVLLASGDYGTFNGGSKSGMVTIKEQSGATARFSSISLVSTKN